VCSSDLLEAQSIAVAERFGLESMLAFSRTNILGSMHRLGLWDETLAGADEIIATDPAAGPSSMAHVMRVWVRVPRDDLAGALEDSTYSYEVARRSSDPQTVFPAFHTHAYVLDSLGRTDEARELLVGMLDRMDALKQGLSPAIPAEMVDLRLRIMGRERTLRGLTGWAHDSPWTVAGRAFVEGDFARAIELYGEMESLADLALTHLRAAEADVEQGRRPEADAHLAAALSFYRAVGATRLVRAAERLLAASA